RQWNLGVERVIGASLLRDNRASGTCGACGGTVVAVTNERDQSCRRFPTSQARLERVSRRHRTAVDEVGSQLMHLVGSEAASRSIRNGKIPCAPIGRRRELP